MSIRSFLALAFAVAVAGCARNEVRREAMTQGPVVLPNRMCAAHGRVAMSSDKPGERMICELQEPLGSHMPKCVCWDEGYAEDERNKSIDMMREVGSIQACGSSPICTPPPSGAGR